MRDLLQPSLKNRLISLVTDTRIEEESAILIFLNKIGFAP